MGVYRAKELLAPASLETIHRKIMGAVHSVEKDVNHFQSRQLTNVTVNPDWNEFVRSLCERHSKEIKELRDFKDLKALLDSEEAGPPSPKKESRGARKEARRTTAKTRSGTAVFTEDELEEKYAFETKSPKQYLEFEEVKKLCERGKVFDYVAFSIKNLLETTYNMQFKKYCLSFEQDGKGETLNSVREYENKIIRWSSEIQGKLEKIDSILDEHDRYKARVDQYLSDYGQVIAFMSETCRLIFQIIDSMKKWVSSDATYARRVQEEINQYNRIKMDLKDKIQVIEDQRDNTSATTKRKDFHCMRLEQDIQQIRNSKKGMKRQELDIGDVLLKINAEITRKKRDLDDVKSRLITRKENSPTVFNYLSSKNESIKDDLRALEGKVRAQQAQVMLLQKDQIQTQKDIDAMSRELRENHKSHEKSYKKLEKSDAELRKARETLHKLENQLNLLKRIREIKLHTNTVKRIYHFGYTPGQMQNRDELEEAIRITADSLGRDWALLYQKLPFQPYRDYENRSRDIEVIDLSTRRVQSGGFRTLALKCLEKWRRLHNAPTLNDLVKTLKALRKKDTVHRIQKEVMLAASPTGARKKHPNFKHFYITTQ